MIIGEHVQRVPKRTSLSFWLDVTCKDWSTPGRYEDGNSPDSPAPGGEFLVESLSTQPGLTLERERNLYLV